MAGNGLAPAFTAHRAQLLRYLRARGADGEAEDCLQDLWIRAQTSDPAQVDDPLAYLYRMAHNLMLDRRRADIRRGRREAAYHDSIYGGGAHDDVPGAVRTLVAREQLLDVEAALKSLGARTDHIFRRHRIDAMAQRAIAAELGITLSAVEKHLQKAYRAIAALRHADVSGGGPSADDEGGPV